MREELKVNLLNMLIPYIGKDNLSDVKWKLEIELSKYEISERCTELAVVTEGKNQAILKKFIASKLAAGRTKRTLEYYKNTLVFFFNKMGKDFDEITADDIRWYLAVRVNRDNVTKTTANNERRNISAFYKWLQVEEVVLKNPMLKVDQMKVNKVQKKAFSDMDIELIRDACRTNKERALVELLISTWCRVSEVAQIQLTDIEGDEILVHGKGEKDRTVYLNAKAKVALQRYLEERKDSNPYLFAKAKYAGDVAKMTKGVKKADSAEWYTNEELVDPTGRIDAGTIEGIIRNIGKRAGVENTHPHRFRRTGATFALRNGMPLVTVSKLLGHANIGVTQLYLDITDNELEEAHKKFVR